MEDIELAGAAATLAAALHTARYTGASASIEARRKNLAEDYAWALATVRDTRAAAPDTPPRKSHVRAGL